MFADSPEKERFAAELGRVYRSWRTLVDTQLRPLGMTQARWMALLYIARGGSGMLQKDLAERMGIEGPTLVKLLDALEAAGLVARTEAEGDRRGKTLALTPAAAPIVGEIERVVAGSRQRLLGDVSDADIASCIRVFETIRDNIAAYDHARERAGRDAAGED